MIRRISAPLIIAAALLAVACGGSDASSKPSTGSNNASATSSSTAGGTGGRETSPALPVTVKDKDGKDVTVKDVSRIIPLNGDIAEIISSLGLKQNVVAADVSATMPSDYQSCPALATSAPSTPRASSR